MKRARRLDTRLLIYRELNALGCLVLEDFRITRDRDLFRLLLFRDIADEVDMKETILQGCIGDNDMFSEVETSFERALRDAAM